MNLLTTIVILIIVRAIATKNWDKIQPVIQNIINKTKNNNNTNIKQENIELTKNDIEEGRQIRLNFLLEEKQKRQKEIQRRTQTLKEEIRKIDVQIYLLKEQQINKTTKIEGI